MDYFWRNMRSFRIETYRLETMCGKCHHVFFTSRDKQQVSFSWQLFQPEAVMIRYITALNKSDLRSGAVHFDVLFPNKAIHRLLF